MRIVAIHQYVDLINKVFKENLETSFRREKGVIEYQSRKSTGRGTPTKLDCCVWREEGGANL